MLVFVGALDDLLLIAAGLSAVGALGALLLRSGPAPAPPARVAVAQQRSAPAVRVDAGPGQDGAVGRDFVPDRTNPGAAGNGRPVEAADGMIDLGMNARTRDS
jgi:hypothetical protein